MQKLVDLQQESVTLLTTNLTVAREIHGLLNTRLDEIHHSRTHQIGRIEVLIELMCAALQAGHPLTVPPPEEDTDPSAMEDQP